MLAAVPSHRWALVTSSTRPLALVRLRAAGLPVPKFFITSSEVQHGKPHPEPYLKAASAMGFSASDCVVVEDVPAGIRAGKAAGAAVIGMPTTASEAELRAAGADWVVANCAAISLDVSNRPEEKLRLILNSQNVR